MFACIIVVNDAVCSGEQLLSLIKQQSPLSSEGKKHHHGADRDDRGGGGRSVIAGSREMRGKARPASELEAEWRKEEDQRRAAEDESQRLEEEKRQRDEELAEQERLKQVH